MLILLSALYHAFRRHGSHPPAAATVLVDMLTRSVNLFVPPHDFIRHSICIHLYIRLFPLRPAMWRMRLQIAHAMLIPIAIPKAIRNVVMPYRSAASFSPATMASMQ